MSIGVGDVLQGDIRLDEQIGEGSFGRVFRGLQLSLDRPVAVKVLKLDAVDDPDDAWTMFEREQKVLARIASTGGGIAQIYLSGRHEGVPFFVMEWLEGRPLSVALQQDGVFSEARVLRVAEQIGAVLDDAHKLGIIHRDLKPGNLFELKDGRIKIIDFGLGRLYAPSERDPLRRRTATGMIKGTIQFMAPEQAAGRELDGRTDIFAVGVVLYALLTNRRPYDDRPLTDTQLAVAIASGEPYRDVRMHRPDLSEAVAQIVRKCMAHDPAARFQTGAELKHAARGVVLTHTVPAGPSDRTLQAVDLSNEIPTVTPRSAMRAATPRAAYRWVLLVLGGIAALVAAGFAGALIATRRGSPPATSATVASPTAPRKGTEAQPAQPGTTSPEATTPSEPTGSTPAAPSAVATTEEQPSSAKSATEKRPTTKRKKTAEGFDW
jgi:serine/threonine-protein kinase